MSGLTDIASITVPARPALDLPNLAFIGKAGSGKSTSAEYVCARYGYAKISFATGVRDAAEVIWGPEARNDREKLQKLGTDMIRAYDPDAWCNLLARRLDAWDEVPTSESRPVIDDCRFPNEYDMLKERGFVFVRVELDRDTRIIRLRKNGKLQDEAQLEHASETALDGYADPDYVITNALNQQDLYDSIDWVLQREAMRR